jgi:hypothetical protein
VPHEATLPHASARVAPEPPLTIHEPRGGHPTIASHPHPRLSKDPRVHRFVLSMKPRILVDNPAHCYKNSNTQFKRKLNII